MKRVGILVCAVVALLLSSPVLLIAVPPSGTHSAGTVASLLQRAGNRKFSIAERMAAAKRALTLAKENGDIRAEGHAHYALAQVGWETDDLGTALEQCHIARRLLTRAGDREGALSASRRSGDILLRLGDYGDAMQVYVRALHEAETLAAERPDRSHRLAVAHVHVMMGNVLRRTGDWDQALAEYRLAVATYRAEKYELGCAGLHLNMGNLLADQGRPKEALPLFKKAERTGLKLGNTRMVSLALRALAGADVALGRLATARTLLARSFELCSKNSDTRCTMHNEMIMGDLLKAAGHAREAFDHYGRALQIAERLHDRTNQAEIHGLIADGLHSLGRDAQAFEHLARQREISRKMLDAETSARISGLRIAYAVQRRDAQITLLRERGAAERTRSRLLAISLGAVIILLLITGTGLVLRARGHRVILRQKKELEQAYRRMEELSRTDALTSLPNRRDALLRLASEIARSLRSGETFGLGAIDVDGFKQVNDTLGHQAGDRTLMDVAKALRGCLREPDYVARWGGDEFLVIVSAVDAGGLEKTSGRIHAAIAELPALPGGIRLTVSCGFVLCRGGEQDEWLQRVDEALYRAKEKGRNRSEIVPCRRS